jgi:putative sigma-54 modulation protein
MGFPIDRGEGNMIISIQARGFELTEGLRTHTERRIRFALGWARFEIQAVSVRLSDINGPRGGKDKRCLIRIPLASGQEVVVEDLDDDLYVAIDRAAVRCERSLVRRLSRAREHRNRRPDFAARTFEAPMAEPAADASTFH